MTPISPERYDVQVVVVLVTECELQAPNQLQSVVVSVVITVLHAASEMRGANTKPNANEAMASLLIIHYSPYRWDDVPGLFGLASSPFRTAPMRWRDHPPVTPPYDFTPVASSKKRPRSFGMFANVRYTSIAFSMRCEEAASLPSIGTADDCYENAFGTVGSASCSHSIQEPS